MSGTKTPPSNGRAVDSAAHRIVRYSTDDLRAALAAGLASGPATPARSATAIKAAGRARLAASNGA